MIGCDFLCTFSLPGRAPAHNNVDMNSSSLLGVELAASSIPKGPECDSPSRRRNHSQITLLDRRRRDEDDDPASNNSSNNKRSKTGVSQRSIINSSSPSPSKYSGPAISNSLDSIQSYLLELVRNMQESFPYCKVASDRRSTYCYNRVRQQLEIIKVCLLRLLMIGIIILICFYVPTVENNYSVCV